MEKFSLAIIAFVLTIGCGNQQINHTEFDKKAAEDILIGHVNLEGLKSAPFNEWFNAEFEYFQQDDSSLNTINKDNFIDHVKITMVLATWCGDSKREVPRFYKILEYLQYDLSNMTVICVNTRKTAKGTNVEQLDIQKVPTFIFYKEGIELGRIIETPKLSLEKDMAEIVGQ